MKNALFTQFSSFPLIVILILLFERLVWHSTFQSSLCRAKPGTPMLRRRYRVAEKPPLRLGRMGGDAF
jgi:hypothetical protein